MSSGIGNGQAADTTRVAQRSQPAQTKMSPVLIDVMFVAMLRSMSFFDEVRRFVSPALFDDYAEGHYKVLYEVLVELRAKHDLFHYSLVYSEVCEVVSANPQRMLPNLFTRLTTPNDNGLLFAAFTAQPTQVNLIQARVHLQRFLYERQIASPLRSFVESVDKGSYPAHLNDFLDSLQNQRHIVDSMVQAPIVEAMPSPDERLAPPSVYHNTGMKFIDGPLGGMREGDANGILGVIGAGKSTLAAHMAVEMARAEWTRAIEEGRAPRLIVLVTYEESAKKMRPRIWSAAAQIKWDKLEKLQNPWLELSNASCLQDYELSIVGDGPNKEGEYERWCKARVWLNQMLVILDLSGSEDHPGAGTGGVDEVAGYLEFIVRDCGRGILSLVLDYAGLAVERHIYANDLEEATHLRRLLKQFGDKCRRDIAERYRSTVWVVHQIAPSNATKSPMTLLHHSMAAESRAFAEHLAVCGCLGVPDTQTGCRLLNWSKTRYSSDANAVPSILRIDEQFAMIQDVTADFVVNDTGRSFVRSKDKNQVGGDAEQAKAQQAAASAHATQEAPVDTEETSQFGPPPVVAR